MISFQQQLSRIIVLVIVLVVTAMVLIFLLIEGLSLRQSIVEKFYPQGETIAINVKPMLLLNEAFRAQEILATMAGDSTIVGVYLFNRNHEPFAYYERSAPIGTVRPADTLFPHDQLRDLLSTQEKKTIFTWNYLAVFVPVMEGGKLLGTVYIVGSLEKFYRQVFLWIAISLVASGMVTTLGVLLSNHLQRAVSDPIQRLAEKMRSLSAGDDYTPHIEPRVNREVDALVSGFNDMISRIAAHERALEEINASLETRIAERTAELNTSLQEKELLLREIHHRVKNNLQVIVSLLSLQMKKVKDPEAISALAASLSRTRSISLIHEKLYATSLGLDADADSYLSDLCREIFRLHNISPERIALHLDLTSLRLDPDRLVNLALLLNELLTNAFKHAFPPQRIGGEVAITLKVEEQNLCLRVRDNGSGLPAGFDLQQATSLGLRLVTNLTRQLGGTFSLRNTDSGLEAQLLFPRDRVTAPPSPSGEKEQP